MPTAPLITPDPLYPMLVTLAQTLDETLTLFGAATCRTFVAPGGSPPWDVCCKCDNHHEGQAWVAVNSVGVSDGSFPSVDSSPLRCAPSQYVADLTVGILRCAATMDDSGEPPSVDRLLDDARKVSRDRVLMLDAVLCRWAEDADLFPGGLVLGPWTPLGPDGGCVGGQISLTIEVPACRCLDDPPPTGGFGIDPFGTSAFGGS